MEEKKVTNHYHLTDIGLGVYMIFVLVGVVVVTLALGVKGGDPWAIAISAMLVTLLLVGIGIAITLFIMRRAQKHEVERSKVERVRELDDTKERLATMELQSRAQLAQGRAQTEGWRTVNQQVKAQALLTGSSDNGPDGIIFDDELFDVLDEVD
jgi:type VI protein secretion system component VasK